MFSFLFPKLDPNTQKYWKFISQQTKQNLKTHDEICYVCKKPSANFKTHFSCKKTYSPEQVVTCFYYNHYLKNILLKFKYYHQKQISQELAQIMKTFYLMYLPTQDTALTFIPMHRIRKFFIKWYNQSEILAQNLAKQLKLPLVKICKKTKYTKPQAKILWRQNRLLNLHNSFKPENSSLSNIKNIVVIDDLITTGSTLEELTKCIKKSHPHLNIFALTLARK